MANELTTVDTKLPSLTGTKKYGVDLGDEDIIIPRLTLLQPTSQIDGAGKFYYPMTGKTFDVVTAVFFENKRGRVMFDPDISKMTTLCGSDDRIVPAPRYESPISGRCAECQYSKRQFKTPVTIGRDTKYMECSETQALKGMFTDDLNPFWFIGRKTSLFPINQFLTAAGLETRKYNKPLCCFPVEMRSAVVQKTGQKYYIPVIKQLGMIEKEEFIRMMEKYKHADLSDTLEQEAATKDGVAGESVPF